MPPSPASLHHDMPNHDSPIEAAPMPSESISLSDGGRHESLPAVKTAKEKHQRPSAASPIDAAKPPTPISLKMSKERLIREANDQTNSKSRRSKATKTLKKMEGHVPNRKIEQIPSPVPPKVVQSPSKAAFKPGLPSSHGDWLSLEKVISSIQGKKVSTIGIAVAVSGQKLTARGDWSCSFKLLDSSNMDRPFMVNMFSKEPFTALPYEGCPLLLHELVIRRFGKTADDEEKPAGVGYADSLKEKEKQYVNDLNDWWRGLQAEMPNNPQTTTTFKAARAPKRELLIKDAKIREFFIAHVLHIWTESDTNFHPHVYVTDYTPLPEFAHSSHVYNPDLSRFDGILLRISLYDGDKEAASVLKIGGFYTFGNLHFVDGRRGTYAKQGQGASKIFRLTDPEKIRQLSLRKKKFFEQRSSASITANKEETAAHLSQNLPPDIIATTLTRHSRPIIRCEYEDQPISNIASILANNNFPNKYRLQAKLVSIRPSKVEEAIVGYCTLHKRRLKVQERRCHECGMDDDPQYSFLLMICVQDQAGDTLDVVISGEEAKALIGVEPMLILDDESDALSQLRSRLAPLFRLIGESGKAAGRTTAPLLDLAVQSWKANVNGAEFPVYRLFGCTLQSE
ncbi:hypothetical protein SISSUDRAFT_591136 [Sistotremastrum suecicum HHB10207 ss-3]|uniref:Protection of telomeres protein 1 n=1 Tax=Sistotremastrum suecicum HHB10207 ss-3 TaxID=1314776 RepID=A0A166EMD8_9AGAM|nr:hypothetical protein SISSUDRAFT_591136 [Sistotremastrum suecicum HHB10207 ss-3]